MSMNGGDTQPPETASFDSLFDQHFGGEGMEIDGLEDTGDDGAGSAPADHDDEALLDDGDDTPDRGRAGDGNTDDDEWDDEEDGDDEDGDDEPDTDPKDGKPDARGRGKKEEAAGGKPGEKDPEFFDRKEIDQIQDPEAKKVAERAYKSMQSAFTRKTTELAEKEKGWQATVKEADEYRTEYTNFVQEIGSDQGAEQFLHLVAEARPHVFSDTVLVDLALRDPARWEKVSERVQRLLDDEDAAGTFREKVSVSLDKYAQERDRTRTRQVQATQQQQQLDTAIRRQAATHEVKDPASLEIIQGQVQLLVQKNQAARKKTTMEEVNAVVDRVAKRLRQTHAAGEQEGERRGRRRQQEDARSQARRAKQRRPAPTGRRDPAPERRTPTPPRGDSSRSVVDRYFGD